MLSYNCPDCFNKTLGDYIINIEYDYCLDCKRTENFEFNFVCNKCGKSEGFSKDDFIKKDCWHSIYVGQGGYGSKMDGMNIEFALCDDCLYEFTETFKIKLKEVGAPFDVWKILKK